MIIIDIIDKKKIINKCYFLKFYDTTGKDIEVKVLHTLIYTHIIIIHEYIYAS